jgi:hypothetical protein
MATRWIPIVAGLTLTVGLCGKAAASPPSVAVAAFNKAGTAADSLARAKTEVTRIFGEGRYRRYLDGSVRRGTGRCFREPTATGPFQSRARCDAWPAKARYAAPADHAE